MNAPSPRIAYFPLGRIHFDVEYAQRLSDQVYEELRSHEYKILGSAQILWTVLDVQGALKSIKTDEVDLVLVHQTTFTGSNLVMEIANHVKVPIAIWSVPEEWTGGRLKLNSYAGMQLAAHALHKQNVSFFYIYSGLNNQKSLEYLESIGIASRVVRALRSTKIGLIGDHPDGFESSKFDHAKIQSIFGITVEEFDLNHFFDRINSISQSTIATTKHDLEKKLINLENLSQGAVEKSIATNEALLELQVENELNGVALRCWPEFFEDFGCAACGALSLAAEKGLACSCEADVLGLITQLILQMASGNLAQGADIVGFNIEENTAALWHCGKAPFSMANPNYPLEATDHGNRKLPLLMQFPFKPGPITLARLTQADKQIKLIVGTAEMLDRPRPFAGTCGVLRFERSADQVLESAMTTGMEHHTSFTYGNCRSELELIGRLLGIPILQL